jgi:hypothetical protein
MKVYCVLPKSGPFCVTLDKKSQDMGQHARNLFATSPFLFTKRGPLMAEPPQNNLMLTFS